MWVVLFKVKDRKTGNVKYCKNGGRDKIIFHLFNDFVFFNALWICMKTSFV